VAAVSAGKARPSAGRRAQTSQAEPATQDTRSNQSRAPKTPPAVSE